MATKTRAKSSTRPSSKPRPFEFTLILTGSEKDLPEIASRLRAAGHRDRLQASKRSGVVYIACEQGGESLVDVMLQTIAEVERALESTEHKVVRIEPDDLVTTSEIARRTGRSRESIRLYALGERGPGEFPPPISNLRSRSPLYRWSEVAEWFANYIQLPETETAMSDPMVRHADVVGTLNAILDLRRLAPTKSEAMRLWRSLDSPPLPVHKPKATETASSNGASSAKEKPKPKAKAKAAPPKSKASKGRTKR